ncbi:alpha/beta-hydrolase [Schizopora paradoxa]|uniref:Alpha/beta-hydrolase n=1 Tax=Schizopora paradoxa TaxID=27342 RepID=A0A0H2RXB8_9AGAM|nr:alpha/beta-hydrolase [Schizopora paradoxa]
MFEFRRQPLWTVYVIYFVLSTFFVRVPIWVVTALIPSSRPRRSWSISRSFIFPALRAALDGCFRISFPSSSKHDPEYVATSEDAQKFNFTWCPSVPKDLLVGEVEEIAQRNGVELQKTYGYWFTRPGYSGAANGAAQSDEKVILHLHGGGYICASAHPKGGGNTVMTSGFFENCPSIARIFCGAYRLSTSVPFPSANPFPAALLDAAATYYYLLHAVGFRHEQVIISGDSAGGHLALALVRYLAIHQFPTLPVPGSLLLISPTVDWAVTHTGKGSSMVRNASSDYCNQFFAGHTKRCLPGTLPERDAATNAWISPTSLKLEDVEGLFKGLPKTYLLAGEAEICLDSYRTLRDRLSGDIGGNLTYNEVKDATHDFLTMSWHEPERSSAFKDIASWITAL